MDPYIFCLISTYVPEHFKTLTFLADGRLIKEERDGKTYANGVLHSFDDKPAETKHGAQWWYKNGKVHRDGDLPAIIWTDGTKEWCKNGRPHRNNDLPALIQDDGTQVWCKKGLFHRNGDKPAIIYLSGTQIWFKNGKYHRDNDKPAIIQADGTKRWFKNGNIIPEPKMKL